MVVARDAGVGVKRDGQLLVITVGGRRSVARLFSGRPAEVTIEAGILDGPPTSQIVPVVHEH